MARATAIRVVAGATLIAGLAAPPLRRRLRLPAPAVIGAAAAAPIALCALVPRSRARDVALCTLQMLAYTATYQLPNADPEALERRVRVRYPVVFDRWVGLGCPPTVRLQRRLAAPGRLRPVERALVWSHWVWFTVPHGAAMLVLMRRRDRFPAGAAAIYATFDLGVLVYWLVPTAPPWYAAQTGVLATDPELPLRRMMVEYGERFWGRYWTGMFEFLGGNPLAAMPSLHFATSVTAARVLSGVGPVAGTVGWTYAGVLGFALVYLGEHYVADLAAGLLLTEVVRRGTPAATPLLRRASELVSRLEARARA